MDFRFLISGCDTIECAYHLAPISEESLDFQRLAIEREELKQTKQKRPKAISLGSEEFLLAPHGTKSGYPFLLENDVFSVQCGEFNDPNFFVTFSSFALWHYGAQALHQRFIEWAHSVGLGMSRPERLSRIDFSFDYEIPSVEFDENSFITTARKDAQYRKNGRLESLRFGEGAIVLRVYDKVAEIVDSSKKTWFFPMWEQEENVWRFEWQLRKAYLRYMGIRTFDDIAYGVGDVLRPLVNSSATLRIKTNDSNRSRWPLHDLWSDLQERIGSLETQGVIRHFDYQGDLDERLMRCGISVYGYLKRIAAIQGLRQKIQKPSKDDGMACLIGLMAKIHDPFSWENDIRKRIKEMQLGQR